MTHRDFLFQHRFDNQLVLVAQSMPWLHSAAFVMGIPAGCRFDPPNKLGLANFTCEMVFRGGGQMNHRELVERLERLGCDYYSNTTVYQTFFGGSLPADSLFEAMDVYSQVVRSPLLPPHQLEDGRQVCLQEIQAIEDDLAGKAMMDLRLRHYGDPHGRYAEGTEAGVTSIALQDVHQFYQRHYHPSQMIIAVAGRIDWPALRDHVGGLFGDWCLPKAEPPHDRPAVHGVHHIPFESNQTHIALAWPNIPFRDPNYYVVRSAIGVLSDGMSSRLFYEVREKRGLCYAVSANCHSLLDRGCVFAYCGTKIEFAQESLDVMVEQVRRLYEDGVTPAELERLKVQVRSSMIMQQESCRSRAGSLLGDMFHLGRLRSLDEINEKINSLTVDQVNRYLSDHPLGRFDLVTLGENALELPDGISSASVA